MTRRRQRDIFTEIDQYRSLPAHIDEARRKVARAEYEHSLRNREARQEPFDTEASDLTGQPELLTAGERIGCALIALLLTAYTLFMIYACIRIAVAIGRALLGTAA